MINRIRSLVTGAAKGGASARGGRSRPAGRRAPAGRSSHSGSGAGGLASKATRLLRRR